MIRLTSSKIRDATFALALWLLGTIYLGVNLAPMHLLVEVTAEFTDTAQLFFSGDGHWSEEKSLTMPVMQGYNRIIFTVPFLGLGEKVRFDPGMNAGTYRILGVSWLRGSMTREIPLADVTNPRSEASELTLGSRELRLQSRDTDPQLIIPTPGWAWTARSAGSWLGIPLLGLALTILGLRRNVGRLRVAGVFLGACALFYCIYVLRVGPILPYYDDWRYLYPGVTSLIYGNWNWMTIASNDTFYFTGQLLDSVVLNLSNVDFFWVRATALALLMLQLGAQYRIIHRVAGEQPAVAAVGVALGVWSLASNAYWGGTAMAYQQALPTLFGTLCLTLLTARDGRFNERFSICLLAACCLASGISYISGGLLLISLGIACMMNRNRFFAMRSDPLARAGWTLLVLGAASLILQLTLVTHQQGSLLEHNHAVASVYPNDRRFWFFFFALYGRALGYTGQSALVDISLAALVLLPGIVFGIKQLIAAKGDRAPREMWTMLAIYAAIGTASYAAIVAFGRAGFVPPTASTADIVTFGKARFHYWPVAAMLPYAWLGWAELVQRPGLSTSPLRAITAFLFLAPKSLLAFNHNPTFLYIQSMVKSGAHCVVNHFADIEAGRPVECHVVTGTTFDIGPTFLQLRSRHATVFREFMQEGGVPNISAVSDRHDRLLGNGFDQNARDPKAQ